MSIYFKKMKEEQKEKNEKKEENKEVSFKKKVLGKVLTFVISAAAAGIGCGIYNCAFRDIQKASEKMLAYVDTSQIQKLVLTSKNPQEQLEQIIAQLAPEQRQEMMARVVYNAAKSDEFNEKGSYSAALMFFQSYQRQKGNKGDIIWEK